ncbi:hypothetical protein HYC85_013945 [Camellia sinensis]|uniref:Uncharacterized protein n=1 Tax=Camellia sinensis TaxID=4442 RepID=A0A7J7H8B1_CAMSI|nr:hypothetical protein HYC85_013945 [Camellia sinensis]
MSRTAATPRPFWMLVWIRAYVGFTFVFTSAMPCFACRQILKIMLLDLLQRDALPLFNMLRKTYKSSIDRELVLNELLDGIAEKFYGVRRRNPLQGIFGDFFKMMGGDGM